jgi:Zn ribbon nucleic-acid-binding protein
MPGCNECKFYKSDLDFYDDDFTSKKTCLAGNTEQMLAWWEENGKKYSEDVSDMQCHEHHESTKSLIEMNRVMDKMIKVVDHISYFK